MHTHTYTAYIRALVSKSITRQTINKATLTSVQNNFSKGEHHIDKVLAVSQANVV